MLESAVKTIVEKFPDVTVLVNSNVGVASEFQDVGIHLPEDLCKFHSIAREKTSDKKTIGSSVHSVPAAEKADENGADYLLVGTMFESESHPGKVASQVVHISSNSLADTDNYSVHWT
mmetsp:Transcript_5550/g.23588  ORF Transcript_5550/g.23588 Transcript_5550/m.23588 type:complete len:118 (-) Transcript_5550:1059-1412(-)